MIREGNLVTQHNVKALIPLVVIVIVIKAPAAFAFTSLPGCENNLMSKDIISESSHTAIFPFRGMVASIMSRAAEPHMLGES